MVEAGKRDDKDRSRNKEAKARYQKEIAADRAQ